MTGTPMTDSTMTATVAALRTWAAGSYPDMAAVELLARAFGGRFAKRSQPWVIDDDTGCMSLNAAALRSTAALSGGERRVLALIASLVGRQPVDIVDVVTGLDREHLDLVLAALGVRRRQPRARRPEAPTRRRCPLVAPGITASVADR